MSSKKEQSEMQYKTEQLKFQIRKKDVVLTYIYMFNIQKSLYAIEHILYATTSHTGFIKESENKQKLIEEEIDKVKKNLNDVLESLEHHYDFIIASIETYLFNKIADDLKELIREVKSDIELTGEFHQCVVDISDKILKVIKKIEDNNESRS